MSAELLLGIDVGTTNCKALVLDAAGRALAVAAAPTPALRPRPGWVEHDPAALWGTVAGVVRAALAQAGAGRVRGVAVASMAEAGLLVDSAGQPLHSVISWDDSRSDEQYPAWLDAYGAERFRALVGNRPNPIFSLFKLLWLRERLPAAYQSAARWLHVADYIVFRLCGAQATDYSLATRTMLFDLAGLRWSGELAAAAGLRADLLPALRPAGARLGLVSAAAAADTGLPLGAAVACAGHDHSCGALAAGVFEPGVALDSMGTAEPAFLPLAALPANLADLPACSLGAHVVGGRYYAAKGVRSSGGAVAWAAQALGFGGEHARLQAAAAQARPGSGGVLFLPRLAPIDRGGFAGLSSSAGPAELARAVYEGLAYAWRANLELIEQAAGARAAEIRVIGGGSQAALWLQIKADVLGRELHVLELRESVALGAALLAGVAAGLYCDERAAAARLDLRRRVVQPDAARAAFYGQCYREAYLPLEQALGGLGAAFGRLPPAP